MRLVPIEPEPRSIDLEAVNDVLRLPVDPGKGTQQAPGESERALADAAAEDRIAGAIAIEIGRRRSRRLPVIEPANAAVRPDVEAGPAEMRRRRRLHGFHGHVGRARGQRQVGRANNGERRHRRQQMRFATHGAPRLPARSPGASRKYSGYGANDCCRMGTVRNFRRRRN